MIQMFGIGIKMVSEPSNFSELPPVSGEHFIRMMALVAEVLSTIMALGVLIAILGYFRGRRKLAWRPIDSRLTQVILTPYEDFDIAVRRDRSSWKNRAVLQYTYVVDSCSHLLTEHAQGSSYREEPTETDLQEEEVNYRQKYGEIRTVYYNPTSPAEGEFRTTPMSSTELKTNFRSTLSEAWALSVMVLIFMAMVIIVRILRCNYDPSLSSPV